MPVRDLSPRTHFRGYAIPGPSVPGVAAGEELEIREDETMDALCGHFRIFQLKKGHRFSTDDILVAWYGSSWCPRAESALDLGSGLGTVAMTVAWRLPGARIVSVEAQEESVRLARKSMRWNGLTSRIEVRTGDFRDEALLGKEETFDLVLGSPPYFALGSGVASDHPQKLACRFEMRGDISDYCRVAAAHLNPGGLFACVFPISPRSQANRVQQGAQEAGLSILRQRPIILREGDDALLGLFAMTRSIDLPEDVRNQTWSEPPLLIRRNDGQVHPEYQAVKMSFGFPP